MPVRGRGASDCLVGGEEISKGGRRRKKKKYTQMNRNSLIFGAEIVSASTVSSIGFSTS